MSKGAETRRRIVRHALRTAAIDGLDGLSIGRLATDLGLSKSGLFAHFRSKEALQLQVLAYAEAGFIDEVVRPALRVERGEPRLRAMFDHWMARAVRLSGHRGGCVFVAAATELDDQPGTLRDAVKRSQEDWIGTLRRAASIAVDEGHFRADLPLDAFAFRLQSLLLGAHFYGRLLQQPATQDLARDAFEALIADARA
jgi:AcrR family transcriptional regulator